MYRFIFLLAVFMGLNAPLLSQEPAAARFSVTARYVPNGGGAVNATIPEAMIGNVTVPLQVTPTSTWLLTVVPTETTGQVSVTVTDTSLARPPAGAAASAPVIVAQGTFPFTFGRPVTVVQSSTYRLEVLLTRL